jgi:hypothetical protein
VSTEHRNPLGYFPPLLEGDDSKCSTATSFPVDSQIFGVHLLNNETERTTAASQKKSVPSGGWYPRHFSRHEGCRSIVPNFNQRLLFIRLLSLRMLCLPFLWAGRKRVLTVMKRQLSMAEPWTEPNSRYFDARTKRPDMMKVL